MATQTRTQGTDRRRLYLALIVAIVALGAITVAYGYWPGVMIDDARWQYQQAVDNAFEDWHPPLMAWVWRRLMFVYPGPAPMLLLQLALYWTGIAAIALWAYRRRRPLLGVGLALAGLLPVPFALTGSVTKDCLMAGLLGCAAACLLWRGWADHRALRAALSIAFALLLLLAAALRFNAFLACVPLALAALPAALTRTKLRLVLAAICVTLPLMATGPLISHLVQAEDTDVQLSLIIFDLGGITEHSGVSVFPDAGVRSPVQVNHACYDPHQWDGYSSWAPKPCPLGFDRIQDIIDQGDGFDARSAWVHAILAHPLAYAEHRLAHFNVSTFFLVADGPPFVAPSQSADNPWGYKVRPNLLLQATIGAAQATAHSPLGWPFFWIALGIGSFILALSARLERAILAIAASAPLYGLGYLVFGVATGMRYHFWTMTCAGIAALLVAGELMDRNQPLPRPAVWAATAVVFVPTVLALMSRALL